MCRDVKEAEKLVPKQLRSHSPSIVSLSIPFVYRSYHHSSPQFPVPLPLHNSVIVLTFSHISYTFFHISLSSVLLKLPCFPSYVNLLNEALSLLIETENLTKLPKSWSLLHGLGESPVPASSVVYLSIFFLVYLCLVFRIVDIYMPVVECGYVPFFADVLSIYSCILLFFRLKGKCPVNFLYPLFISDLI
jgi:hypothetical protein